MRTSNNGIKLIKNFEGCILEAYNDGYGTPTIGYGHTSGVSYGMKITQAEADRMLQADLKVYEDNVNKYMNTYNFNQNEFDSLVSFAYNIGSIDEMVRYGSLAKKDIPSRMRLFIHVGDEVSDGLVRRREEEIKLFNTPVEVVVNMSTCYDMLAKTLLNQYGTGDERKKKLGKMYNIIQGAINTVTDYFEKNI